MPDRYDSFAALAAGEREGIDYRICLGMRASPVAIVAPHGGEIEPGTSPIAACIAADGFSLYCFEGLDPARAHGDLHIASDRFDEPEARRLVEACEIAIAVHGRQDGDDGQAVWLGGRDEALRDAVGEALQHAGFTVKTAGHRLPGRHPDNICNRGRSKAGVQLELPRSLRDQLVRDTGQREIFGAAVRGAIERHIGAIRQIAASALPRR